MTQAQTQTGLTLSEFYMWRALFAVAHADKVVSKEEVRYLAEVMDEVPLSPGQRAMLNEDLKNPQNIEEMFEGVTEAKDQAMFFKLVRRLVYVDGDYGTDEQAILLRLQQKHLYNTNMDDLIGHVNLELADEFDKVEVRAQEAQDDPPSLLEVLKTVLLACRDFIVKKRYSE